MSFLRPRKQVDTSELEHDVQEVRKEIDRVKKRQSNVEARLALLEREVEVQLRVDKIVKEDTPQKVEHITIQADHVEIEGNTEDNGRTT